MIEMKDKAKIREAVKAAGIISLMLLVPIALLSTFAMIPDFCVGIYTYQDNIKVYESRGIYPLHVNPMGYIELVDTRIQKERIELEVVPQYGYPEKVYIEVFWYINKDKAVPLYRNYGGDREERSGNVIQKYIKMIVEKFSPETAIKLYGKDRGNYIDNLIRPVVGKEVKNLYGRYSLSDFYENSDSDDRKVIVDKIKKELANEGITLQQFFITKERANGFYGYLYSSVVKQTREMEVKNRSASQMISETPLVIAIDENASLELISKAFVNLTGSAEAKAEYGEKNTHFAVRKSFSFKPDEFSTVKERLKIYLPEPVGESIGIIFVNNSNYEYSSDICCEGTHKYIVVNVSGKTSQQIGEIMAKDLNYLSHLRLKDGNFTQIK